MTDYIRREDAIKIAERYGLANGSVLGRHTGLADCIASEILSLPAADVAEVRHGRWERVSTASGIISRVRCSVCAGTQPLTFENMPYCPTCGARMDEEDGHEIS